MDTDYRSANTVSWQTIRRLCGKQTPVAIFIEDTNGVLLKQQKGILNCWRDQFCEPLNPYLEHLEVDSPRFESSSRFGKKEKQISEEIHLTEAEVSTAIKFFESSQDPW